MHYPKFDRGNNGFHFSITRGEEFDFLISSGETDQVICFDASNYYADDGNDNNDAIKSYREDHYKVGDDVGFISDHGIWEAEIGTYKGRKCIVAVEGIEDPFGLSLGMIKIFYIYNEKGELVILNLKYISD